MNTETRRHRGQYYSVSPCSKYKLIVATYLCLQNCARENAQRFAFSRAIRALKLRTAPSGSPKGERPAASNNPLRAPRLFIFEKVGGFLIVVLGSKRGFCRATGPPRGCNGHAVMLQRGPRCNAIAAPLQSKEGLTGGPHPALPKERETCVIVSGCVIATCKSDGFLSGKIARF